MLSTQLLSIDVAGSDQLLLMVSYYTYSVYTIADGSSISLRQLKRIIYEQRTSYRCYISDHCVCVLIQFSDHCMIKVIYYLRHSDTHERCFRYYMTLAGARIAQRSRNRRLGFETRIARTTEAELEFEQCVNAEGKIVLATWVIEEDHIELMDLTGPAAEV